MIVPFIAPHYEQALPKAVAIVRHISGSQQLFCSGVPLTERITLTAAHCVHQPLPDADAGTAGQITLRKPNDHDNQFKVLRILVHPEYDAKGPTAEREDFDLALVESESLLTEDSASSPTKGTFQPPAHFPAAEFWLAGFSPVRLGSNDPNHLTKSPTAWAALKITHSITQEGKFLARAAENNSAAACAGDSGAPVWQLEKNELTLIGIVVQGNCRKGDVKIVNLKKYGAWIDRTADRLSAIHQAAWAASKNVLWRPVANARMARPDRE
jgi:secreted trypsin-like serine protease